MRRAPFARGGGFFRLLGATPKGYKTTAVRLRHCARTEQISPYWYRHESGCLMVEESPDADPGSASEEG